MSKGGRRLIELGKDVLIVLLVLSAIWLAGRPQLYGRQMGEWLDTVLDHAGQSGAEDTGSGLDLSRLVSPVRMAVMTGQGRYGTPYDSAGTQTLFAAAAGLLNEALNSAEAPERISRTAWERSLQTAPGIYFEFSVELPLTALAGLLSGGAQGSAPQGRAVRLCLAAEEELVRLFYINEEDGAYYACTTDVVSPGQMEAAIREFSANGVSFAFERQDCEDLASYTMLPAQIPAPPVYVMGDPLTEEVCGQLLERMNFHTQGTSDYEAPDGTVYLNGGDSLRLSEGGKVVFSAGRDSEARFPVNVQGESATLAEELEAACRLVQEASAPFRGLAELQPVALEEESDGSLLVEFDYFINGARVLCSDGGSAAAVTVRDLRIVRVELQARGCAPGTESSALLPVTQAAAAVTALDEAGGELLLCYRDGGADTVRAGWMVTR